MKYGYIALFVSLVLGQLGAIPVAPGVVLYIHDIVVLGLIVSWGVRLGQGKKFIKPLLFTPIVAFIAVSLVSLIINLLRFPLWQVGAGSLYLVRWVMYACLYFMIIQEKHLWKFVLTGLFFSGSAFAIIGLMQYVLYPNLRNLWYLGWDPHYFRLFSTFLDPNFAGIYIVITFLLGLWLFRVKKAGWVLVLELLNGVALYLTYSRSTLVAFVLAIVAWIVLEKKWRALWALFVFVALVILVPKPGGDTLKLLRADSTMSRISNSQEAIGWITKSPLVGYGFNTLRFIPRRQALNADGIVSKAEAGVDNSVLFLVATTGVAGLIIYAWLCFSIVKLLHKKRVRPLQSTGIAILIALGAHSLFLNSLFYPWVMIWIWMFVASCEVLVRSEKRAGGEG